MKRAGTFVVFYFTLLSFGGAVLAQEVSQKIQMQGSPSKIAGAIGGFESESVLGVSDYSIFVKDDWARSQITEELARLCPNCEDTPDDPDCEDERRFMYGSNLSASGLSTSDATMMIGSLEQSGIDEVRAIITVEPRDPYLAEKLSTDGWEKEEVLSDIVRRFCPNCEDTPTDPEDCD